MTVFSFIGSEALYRIYIGIIRPYIYQIKEDDLFLGNKPATDEPKLNKSTTFSDALHIYNREYGYEYPKSQTVSIYAARNDKIKCIDVKFNNIGVREKNYDTANTKNKKILVMGDSMLAYSYNQETIVSLADTILNEQMGHSVALINQGVDGYGTAQMFLRAAETFESFDPDLIVFVSITDDLRRRPSWIKGRPHPSGLTEYVRLFHPDDPANSRYAVTTLGVNESFPEKFCNTNKNDIPAEELSEYEAAVSRSFAWSKDAKKRTDQTNQALAIMREKLIEPSTNLLSPFRSFLFDRLTKGRIWQNTDAPISFHMTRTYDKVPGFLEAYKKISQSKLPIFLIHMPLQSELESGAPRKIPMAIARQLNYLEEITQKNILYMDEYLMKLTDETISKIAISPKDEHPSEVGLKIYAKALAELINDRMLSKH